MRIDPPRFTEKQIQEASCRCCVDTGAIFTPEGGVLACKACGKFSRVGLPEISPELEAQLMESEKLLEVIRFLGMSDVLAAWERSQAMMIPTMFAKQFKVLGGHLTLKVEFGDNYSHSPSKPLTQEPAVAPKPEPKKICLFVAPSFKYLMSFVDMQWGPAYGYRVKRDVSITVPGRVEYRFVTREDHMRSYRDVDVHFHDMAKTMSNYWELQELAKYVTRRP